MDVLTSPLCVVSFGCAQPNGFIGVEKQMTVTITCDHRHIYGAQAAEFLVDLAKLLEKDVESLLF